MYNRALVRRAVIARPGGRRTCGVIIALRRFTQISHYKWTYTNFNVLLKFVKSNGTL